MVKSADQDVPSVVMVAVMGATGTGKSTFIKLLTNDPNIHIGHDPESETSEIATAQYIDQKTGRTVMLIDTPGFDDSREYITDLDVLNKIATFLVPESGQKRTLNGIIYMHRISDPRVSGLSRKNLKMFRSLCGDVNLPSVHIVTTFWSLIGEQEGITRSAALKGGAFKYIIQAGAQLDRHDDTVESARRIVSNFIPLPPSEWQVQNDMEEGKKIEDTDAGKVITAEMQAMMMKHEREMAELKEQMLDAAKVSELSLRAELDQERKELELRIARAQEDQEKLQNTLKEKELRGSLEAEKELRKQGILEARNLRSSIHDLERRMQQLKRKPVTFSVPITKSVSVHASGSNVVKRFYFATRPLTMQDLTRYVSLQLETDAHNQGWASGSSQGLWSWFEIAILTRAPRTGVIAILARAPRTGEIATNYIKKRHNVPLTWVSHFLPLERNYNKQVGLLFDREHQLWEHLEVGDVVGVLACAQYPGWSCDAREAELKINVHAL